MSFIFSSSGGSSSSALQDFKESVRVATTADITLSAPQTIDGVSAIAGDRVLVKDQTTGSENGIYVVAAGAWTRATDFDSNTEVTAGVVIPVSEGTVGGNKVWMLTTNDPIVLGTTALVFSQVGSSTTPGGASGAVQFNDASTFGGDTTNLFWNNTTKVLRVGPTFNNGITNQLGVNGQTGAGIDTSFSVWNPNTRYACIYVGHQNGANNNDDASYMCYTPAKKTEFYQYANGTGMQFLVESANHLKFGVGGSYRWQITGSTGNLDSIVIGAGLGIKEGSNAKMGVATLVAGTVTVSNTAVTASSRIFLTIQNPNGGTPGAVYISARTAATSFDITSTSGADTSIVAWMIVEPT